VDSGLARSLDAAGRAWRADPLRIALFALVFLTVSRANAHLPFLAPLRPLLLLSAAAVAFAVLNPRYLSRLPWTSTWPARTVMALGILSLCSGVFGISLGGSATYFLEEYSKVLILTFLLMATIGSIRDVHWFAWAYVLATGVLVWDALFFFQMERTGNQEFYRLSNLYTYDANDVGVVLLVGLGLAIYTFQVSRAVGKALSLTIILGIGAALAKTGSRGAFLGLIGFGLAVLLLVDSVSIVKRVGFMVVTAVALALASPQGYWQQMSTILAPKEDYNWTAESGRRMTVKRGIGYMLSYPVFGVGIGNFPMAEGTLSDRAKAWRPGDPGVRWAAPHNSFLQAGAELGVPGLLVWSALVGGIVISMTRLGRRLPRSWSRGAFDQRAMYHATRYVPLATIGFAVAGSFVSFAFMDPIYFLAALSVGLLHEYRRLVPRAAARRPYPMRGGARPSA
jgi:O-antigen ligase